MHLLVPLALAGRPWFYFVEVLMFKVFALSLAIGLAISRAKSIDEKVATGFSI